MPRAELNVELARIDIESSFMEKDLVKGIPGSRWDAEVKMWHAPLSWGTCQALRGTFNERLEVGPHLAEWAWADRSARVDPCLQLRVTEDPGDGVFTAPGLFAFQEAGVRFFGYSNRSLCGDEMGLGKSVMGACWLRAMGVAALPALIVCPNTMRRVWARELATWASSLRVVVLSGSTPKRTKTLADPGSWDVVITNWESLRNLSRLAPYGSISLSDKEKQNGPLNEVAWQTVIADEAHRSKDPKAKQTRGLWAVASKAVHRLALTGTPIANHPADLWSLMHFIAPEDWPGKSRFVDRYCLAAPNAFGGLEISGLNPRTESEFRAILEPRFIRRTKAAVLPQLPAKTYQIRTVEMAPKQAKAYEQMRSTMLAELESGEVISATNPLARLTRLQQFACAYATVTPDGVRLTEPSCKVDALEELVDELAGTPAAVFAESRQLIELCERRLAKLGVHFVSIRGGIGEQEREDNITRFQQGDVPICLVTLGAGGEGVTLTAAPYAIFLQRSWSLVKNVQGEDRVHRIGQTARVQVIDLVTEGTVEEHLQLVVKGKAERLEEVVRDRALLLRIFAGEEVA